MPSTELPPATVEPPSTIEFVQSTLPMKTGSAVPTGSVVTEMEREDDKKEGNTGLLVASILLMVVVCGLFGYLMYKESEMKDRDEGLIQAQSLKTEEKAVR
jgi:hypothetical protein